jgi:chromosomal replication initiation ATPase DnaA
MDHPRRIKTIARGMNTPIDTEKLQKLAREMIDIGNAILESLKLVKSGQHILIVEQIPNGISMTQAEQIQFIAAAVGRFYRFTQEQLKSRDRHEHIAWARLVYYWLCRKLTDASLKEVGGFVNRDHGTVISGIESCENRRDTDKSARSDMDSLLNDCIVELKRKGVKL